MAYIYKITNKINNKIYIGKTEFSIEKRFKEHCSDAFKLRNERRPLYSAMQKYGIENFEVSLVEETKDPENRERFWIEYYGSYKRGYNATLGGDGRRYCDYDLIYNLFLQGLNIAQIAQKLGYSTDTCSNVLHLYKVDGERIRQRGRESVQKIIIQKDKDTKQVLNIFPSIQAAYNYLGKQHSGHIASVCNGKRKTAYGFIWEYGI